MNEVLFSYTQERLEKYDPSVESDHALMDLIKDGKEHFIKEFNTPITHIYVDIRYLRDWRMGAILALCNESDKTIIADSIEKYNTRTNDDILSCYPELSITENDIQRIIHDPVYLDGLLLKSPSTVLYRSLPELFTMILRHNARISPTIVTKLCINFYPFTPTVNVKNFYARLCSHIHPSVKLNVMSHPLSDIPSDVLLVDDNVPFFQIMYIYHLQDFLSSESNHARSFLELLRFHKSSIFSPKHIGDAMMDPNVSTQDIDKAFEATHALLNICAKFEYLNPIIS